MYSLITVDTVVKEREGQETEQREAQSRIKEMERLRLTTEKRERQTERETHWEKRAEETEEG